MVYAMLQLICCCRGISECPNGICVSGSSIMIRAFAKDSWES